MHPPSLRAVNKSIWYTSKWAIISYHILAWIAWFLFPHLVQINMNQQRHLPPELLAQLIKFHKQPQPHLVMRLAFLQNIVLVVLFYTNAYRFVPLLLYRRKAKKYVALMLGLLITLTFIFYKLHEVISGDQGFFRPPKVSFPLFFLFIIAVSTSYRIITDKIKSDRLQTEKENANLQTELLFLRSQISPHFVFNVLNNMVSLARKHSDQLESSLITLSGLMRYMLYEANTDKVLLSKEIEYLEGFVELQQQRFTSQVDVDFIVNCHNRNLYIEPMLLIPFVENAFKHGIGLVKNPVIKIKLEELHGRLFLEVKNNFNNSSGETKDKTPGIGLTNVKRRLDLLYGTRHSLFIKNDDNEFLVQLQLNLT
jgi:hypothetical protein